MHYLFVVISCNTRSSLYFYLRVLVKCWFLLVLIPDLCMLVSPAPFQLVISGVGFCLGFSLYGSIALYGVIAVESAPVHISGSAYSIVAASANGEYSLQ